MTAKPPTRPVVRYHGGKFKLAPWIIEHFPPHDTYVEPYGGGGSILMRKPRSRAEIYNDRWGEIVNVFRVLRDPVAAAELERQLRLTPFAREEFELARKRSRDPIERARRAIFRSMCGFGSDGIRQRTSTGFRANSQRSGTTPAHDWASYPDQIERFTARLTAVTIENRSAIEVMLQHDTPTTLHYVDPPYVHTTRKRVDKGRAYACEMTDAQHRTLAETLHSLKGAVVLSGYACPLYDELFGEWPRVERLTHADGAHDRIEVLWLSRPANQHQLFT